MARLPDLKKLRHVVVVARAGSFTGASRQLAMTQSALTKSVADVESLAGMALFERLPRGVRLTEAGARFVERAESILEDAGELLSELEGLAELRQGHLRIGVTPASFVAFLVDSVSAFARVYPGVQIEIREGTIDDVARELVTGRVDVGVGAANYLAVWKEFDIAVVKRLHQYFIGRPDHPAGPSPTAQALLAYPIVLPAAGLSTEAQLAAAYSAAGLSPRPPQYVCEHFSLVTRIVSATNAISPVMSLTRAPARFRKEFTLFEGIIELDEHFLGIATLKRRPSTPAVTAFSSLLQSFLGEGEPALA